jgi:hypothetical protein
MYIILVSLLDQLLQSLLLFGLLSIIERVNIVDSYKLMIFILRLLFTDYRTTIVKCVLAVILLFSSLNLLLLFKNFLFYLYNTLTSLIALFIYFFNENVTKLRLLLVYNKFLLVFLIILALLLFNFMMWVSIN